MSFFIKKENYNNHCHHHEKIAQSQNLTTQFETKYKKFFVLSQYFMACKTYTKNYLFFFRVFLNILKIKIKCYEDFLNNFLYLSILRALDVR